MSTSQDEVIELIDLNSEASSEHLEKGERNLESVNVLTSPHKENRSHDSEIGNIFVIKSKKSVNNISSPSPSPASSSTSRAKAVRTRPLPKKRNVQETEMSESSTNYESNKSESKSYRDKIRERFESVKKHAGQSANKVEKLPRLRGETKRIKNLNKMVDVIKKDNTEIEKDIEKHKKDCVRVRDDDRNDKVTRYDRYVFFCLENINKHENANEEDLSARSKSPAKSDSPITFCRPDNINIFLKIAENEMLWNPNRFKSGTYMRPNVNEGEIRDLTEEGFYVSEKPNMKNSYLNVMERRLLNDENPDKWLNSMGTLQLSENPHNNRAFRQLPSDFPGKPFNNLYNITEYVKASIETSNVQLDSVIIDKENVLDVHIHNVKFLHHPLFSAEHVLQEHLIKHYDHYKDQTTRNALQRTCKKIDALKLMLRKCDEESHESKSGDTNENMNVKIMGYRQEIKMLTDTYLEKSKEFRENIATILDTWRSIKRLRERNSYSSTAIKLVIRKEKNDGTKEAERKHMKRQVEEYYENEMEILRADYETEIAEYHKLIAKWKRSNASKRNGDANSDDDDNTTETISKPKKPKFQLDEETLHKFIEKKFKLSLKPPGEPTVHFSIVYDNEISPIVDDVKEKQRRTCVLSTRIYFKLLCNEMLVCKSKIVPLNDIFCCVFDDFISLHMKINPDKLSVEIYEQSGASSKGILRQRKLGEVRLQVSTNTHEEHFVKEEIVHYNSKHGAVGSGVEMSSVFQQNGLDLNQMSVKNRSLNTCGFVNYNLIRSKSAHVDADYDANLNGHSSTAHLLKKDGLIDFDKLVAWVADHNLDPQDPKNSLMFEYINGGNCSSTNHALSDMSAKKYFRLDHELSAIRFGQPDELNQNLRFKVLALRDNNEPEFANMIVPNRLREIPPNILSVYKKRVIESRAIMDEENYYEDEVEDDSIEAKRSWGQRRLKIIYAQILQKCKCLDHNLAYEDVVNERFVTHVGVVIRTIIYNIINWFRVQPSISRPIPKWNEAEISSENKNTTQQLQNNQPQILINVISGMNLPQRADKANKQNESLDNLLRPKIIVTYDNLRLCSNVASGHEPLWNEELSVPLQSSAFADSLSEDGEGTLSKSLYVHLFDEVAVEKASEQEKNAVFSVFLGSVRIPISAICSSCKISGIFRLKKPAITFGYDEDTSRKSSFINTNGPSYLKLNIVVDTNVPAIHPNMNELPSNEPAYLRQHILKWNRAYNANYPSRKFSALVLDVNGRSVCATRYIRPIEPPQVNRDGFDPAPHQCARFISSIPFAQTNKFYDSIWLTTDQMLKLGHGTIFDHAVALTCYLTALNMECWLMMATGLPHGLSGYVLTKEFNRDLQNNEHFIYDVVTGTKHNIIDNIVPVQRIYCVINANNLWANMQKTDNPTATRFDFTRRGDWMPLFNNELASPTNSMQTKVNYLAEYDVGNLESRIEKKVMKRVMLARKLQRTIWNHGVAGSFKRTMRNFELQVLNNATNLEVHSEIKSFLRKHQICGFIMDIPFSNIKGIVKDVLTTELHLNDMSNVEYVLAVHLHKYNTNYVIVAWIMFGLIKCDG